MAFWSRERAATAKKLFSLSGVAPVGVFVVLHLIAYYRAVDGRAALEEILIEPGPALLVAELGLVWLPLAYHASYGALLTLRERQNLGQAPYGRRSLHLLQRLTGLVVFAFVVYHGWQLRAPLLTGELIREDVFPELVSLLSSTTKLDIPVVAVVYLVGIAATSFHLGCGMFALTISSGLVRSSRGRRVASAACSLLGVALFWLGATTVFYFATGAGLLAPFG